MKRFLPLSAGIVLGLCISCCVFAQTGSSKPLILNVRGGVQLGFSATEFFNEYSKLGGTESDFGVPISLNVAAKIPYELWNVGLDVGYYRTRLDESFTQDVVNDINQKIGVRSIKEQARVFVTPLLLCAEYTPFQQQFKSYIGAGAGVGMIKSSWVEQVQSTIPGDVRTGGTHVDKLSFVPALRVYNTLQFDFDNTAQRETIGSVVLQFSYTYMPNRHDAFASVAAQLPSTSFQPRVQMGASSIAISLGFQYQLSRKKN